MRNRNEKSYNPLSHVAPFFKQVDFHNVKYCVVIDLTSLYITINGDWKGLISEMMITNKKAKFHLNEHKNIRNTESENI